MKQTFNIQRGFAVSLIAMVFSGHAMPSAAQSTAPGMSMMSGMDMDANANTQPTAASGEMSGMEMESMPGMDMGSMQGGTAPPDARDPNAYAEGVPMRPMPGMDMADDALYSRVLFNELEYANSDRGNGQNLNLEAWYGGDLDKVWLKMEGERHGGSLENARTEILWNRNVVTYWSTQLGLRHDNGTGRSKNWLAVGVQGLSPYWFETEATAYVGSGGSLAARLEARYELLLTQRWILEPKLETNLYSKNAPDRNIGSGLSDVEFGLRLRYEVRRQFAPYIGISWKRSYGDTANYARAAGEDISNTEFVAGVRAWF